MFKISINDYESIVNSFVDAMHLRAFDNDQIHDHIETIDNDFELRDDQLIIHNIESLYDSINYVINYIRALRYVELHLNIRDHATMTNDDDQFTINEHTFDVNDIDQFETTL